MQGTPAPRDIPGPGDLAGGGKAGAKKRCPPCKRLRRDELSEDEIREDLSKAERQKTSPSGPHGVHPQVPRELAGGLARPLRKGDAPEERKKAKSPRAEEQRGGRASGRAAGPRAGVVAGGTEWSRRPGRSGEPRGKGQCQQVEAGGPCPGLCPALGSLGQGSHGHPGENPQPRAPPGLRPLSVGLPPLVSWSQQPAQTAARSCAGTQQRWEEAGSGRAATSTGTGSPLPILAVAGWCKSLVPGEEPPVPGAMGQANCCCGSRKALSQAEAVLSADVRLSQGRKRSARRLLLLQEELVVAKLQGGTSVRPQLRLALEQLWVLSGGKEAAGEEEEEEQEGSGVDRSSLVFVWPSGSCIATFGRVALHGASPCCPSSVSLPTGQGCAGARLCPQGWGAAGPDALFSCSLTPEGATRARVTRLPSLQVLERELRRRRAGRTFSATSLERLLEGQAEADPKQGLAPVPSSDAGAHCRSAGARALFSFAAGGSSSSSGKRRRTRLPWPFALRRSPAAAQAPGQAGCGCSRALFGQPLAAVCGEEGTLPRPIQELLAVLQQEGPSTEGIFRCAASGTELQELREALDHGAEVELGRQPALLLAVLLKDFLRSIPSKLLVNKLYEDWMAAMRRTSKEEKVAELKGVAEKLPAANVLLLKRLLSLLRHIGHSAGTSRMSPSNLAVCMGPSLLSPPHEDLLPLEAMLEATQKVKVLVEFLVENSRELFGEDTAELSRPAAEESPAPRQSSQGPHLAEQSVPAVSAEPERQAEALPRTPPSLELGVLREAGGDTVVGSEAGEAPPALPPSTPESAADSAGRPEELASLSGERRLAGSPQAKGKRRGRKRKQAWGEESESRVEKKWRKREEVSGAGPKRRGRRVQEARRPRCVPGSAAHLCHERFLVKAVPPGEGNKALPRPALLPLWELSDSVLAGADSFSLAEAL
ncbi:uncharacterized protein LOC142601229 [Balearica regulorum gibbericeps]|uniref:uncharacterized protein LOC142601229 n=1 Tax=Balearica regulorum gibbericeps TaxID=100784 RepID=UPI003F640908